MIRAALLMALLAATPATAEATRVLALGGVVTEIVYALGEQARLVGRDTTSSYPAAVQALPDVGYLRALSAEGVLSVGPSLILSEPGAGPPEVIAVLRASDIAYVELPAGLVAEDIPRRIAAVGAALGVPDKAAALSARVMADLDAARARAAEVTEPKRVLFVLSAAGGQIMAAGDATAAAEVIAMAGGINAATGFTGYKAITDEAVTAAAPDVILMMTREGAHAISADDLFARPALAVTPAAATKALIRMEGLKITGFGPRTAEAILELHAALYGE